MARGFVLGATAGRTTLTGEGLQHADGHSLLLASTNPAVVTYDPAFAYEIAHIIESGLARMYGENPENIYFYMTIYNEPYVQPAEPENFDPEGLLRGIYRYRAAAEKRTSVAQILTSGVAMPEALRAADMLAAEWDVAADVWSVTSWGELNRDGVAVEKELLRHPERHGAEHPRRTSPRSSRSTAGPVVAVSDWMRAVPEQIRPWVPNTYVTLGADGFGFSDTRPGGPALLQHRRGIGGGGRAGGAGPRRRDRPVGGGRGGPAVPDRRRAGRRGVVQGHRQRVTPSDGLGADASRLEIPA